MGLYPIQQRLTLRCQECDHDFEAKRCDTKYCRPCREIVKARQTAECADRNREKRNADARARTKRLSQKRRREIRDKINARNKERYANDPVYRLRTRAFARRDWHLHGVGRKSYAKQRRRAAEWRKTHPDHRNGQQTAKFRKDACEHCGLNDPRVLTVHHKIPFSKGGLTVAKNLQTLCWNCHKIAHFEMES